MKSRRPGQALVFSEKDLPGYKSKSFVWEADDDENAGQGRSKLYDDAKRKARHKEKKDNKDFTPFRRRAIPKRTAIAGVVTREFDAVPVKNAEYAEVERKKMARLLSNQKPSDTTQIWSPEQDPTRRQNITSVLQRQRENKVSFPQCGVHLFELLTQFRPPQPRDKPSRITGQLEWIRTIWFEYC